MAGDSDNAEAGPSSNNVNNQQAQGFSTPSNFKITIPYFDPEKTKDNVSGWVSARAWVRQVDRAIRAAGTKQDGQPAWDDEMSASMAISTLRGLAANWVEKLELQESCGGRVTALHSWKAFKKVFQARYVTALTLSQQVAKMRNMSQGAKESVLDFRDRVDINTYDLFEAAWTVTDDQVNQAADLEAREKGRKTIANILFASGLSDNIRDKACNLAATDATSEDFVAIARRVELTEQDRKMRKAQVAVVNEVVTEDSSDSEAEVSFVKKGKGKGKGKSQTTQNKDESDKPRFGRFLGRCWHCNEEGHTKANCFKKQKEDAARRFKKVNETAVSGQAEMNQVDLLDYLEGLNFRRT